MFTAAQITNSEVNFRNPDRIIAVDEIAHTPRDQVKSALIVALGAASGWCTASACGKPDRKTLI